MDAFDALRREPSTAGVFLDFDGTLSPIVPSRRRRSTPARGAARCWLDLAPPRRSRGDRVRPAGRYLAEHLPDGSSCTASTGSRRGSTARSAPGPTRALAPGRRRGGGDAVARASSRPASTWSTRACRSPSTSAVSPDAEDAAVGWARAAAADRRCTCGRPRCRSSCTRR